MSREISLPEMKALYEPGCGAPSLVLVAGGRAPDRAWLCDLCRGEKVWAIDRGIDACLPAGIFPSLFIGDGDSASGYAKKWLAERKTPSLIFPPEKDLTDLQLALKIMKADPGGPVIKEAILTGSFGGRFDHMFANVYSLLWAEEEWSVRVRCMADDNEAFFIVRGGEKACFSGLGNNTLISTLSLSPECTGVKTTGTRWPINNGKLFLNRPYAVSNIVAGAEGVSGSFSVEVRSGWLGVYIFHGKQF